VKVFDNYRVHGLEPFDNRLAFGGRTGGEFTGLDLDNIAVQYMIGTPRSPTRSST